MSERVLLQLKEIPAYQNKMFGTADEARACPTGDVLLVQDENSGLVYNKAFDDDCLSYDSSYQNEQGHSHAFQAHIGQVLEALDRHFQSMSILEIGCGKGAFLELLRETGHNAYGIDPAYEGNSEFITCRHFEPGLGIHGDAIIMRHVLEHIPSPTAFLDMVRRANRNGDSSGKIYIEVPCFEWILRRNAWYDVFYEHVNYFRLPDFDRIFGQVLESGSLFGGQYIYVIAELDSLRDPSQSMLGKPLLIDPPADFFSTLDRCAQLARENGDAVIWGAAAKGVMFAHHMQSRNVTPRFAIDINPAKQHCFLAGSGVEVLPPNDALEKIDHAADIFVMNSNYLPEIQTLGGPELNYIAVDLI